MAAGKIYSLKRKQLWSGTLSGNNEITVSNTNDYILFALELSDGSLLLGAKNPNAGKISFYRASMISGSNTQYFDVIQFSVSDNKWTRIGAAEFGHTPGSNHGSATALTTVAIYGII